MAFIFLLAQTTSRAQQDQFSYINYTVSDGLSSNEVHCAIQDDDGTMLFGTDNGMVRFDGLYFKMIQVSGDNVNGLGIIGFKSIDKRIWVNTYKNGLFYLKNDTLYPYKYNDFIIANTYTFIRDFNFDENGDLYYVYYDHDNLGVIQIDASNGVVNYFISDYFKSNTTSKSYQYVFTKDCIILNQSANLATDKYGNVNENYFELNKSNDRVNLQNKSELFDIKKISKNRISDNQKRRQGVILKENDTLIYEHNVLFNFNNSELIYFNDRPIIKVKNINNELYVLDLKKVVKLNSNYEILDTLYKGLNVTNIFKDDGGGVWLTSLTNGVYYHSNNIVKSVKTQSGYISNVSKIDRYKETVFLVSKTGQVYILDLSSNKILFQKKLAESSGALYADERGIFFNGVMYSNQNLERLSTYGNSHPIMMYDIFKKPKEDYVFAATTRGGVKEINLSTGEVIRSYPDKSVHTRTVSLYHNKIYIGFSDGLRVYNKNTDQIARVIPDIDVRVEDIEEFGDNLVVSTKGLGVYIINNDSVIDQFSETKYLISNYCSDVEVLSDSSFMVGTQSGISHIVKQEHGEYRIRNITTQDGLSSGQINDLEQVDDKIIIASRGNLDILTLTDLYKLPDISFNGYFYDDAKKSKEFKDNDTVILNKGRREVNFIFNLISFGDRENFKYEWILNGNKIKTNGDDECFLNNLNPGYNNMNLKVLNLRRPSQFKTYNLIFYVPYYLYELLWFQALILFLILALVAYLIITYINNSRIKQNLKLKQATAQYSALSLQLNPHFIFNSLNNIQYLSVSNSYYAVNQFVSKLSRLTRNVLESSKNKLVPLKHELKNLELYVEVENMRFDDYPIEFNVELETGIDLEEIVIPPMILQPTVENAIWHGLSALDRTRILSLIVKRIERGFSIVIRDNGEGFKNTDASLEKSSKKSSVGISNTRERIQLYNDLGLGEASFRISEIRDSLNQVQGVEVTFVFYPKSFGR